MQPNVIVFLLDDTNPTPGTPGSDTYGQLWSNPDLTPNLYDLFVNHGINFDHAYGETPLCCPSRATLLTGLHTHNHGVIRNDVRLFNPAENVGKEMGNAGYSSMLIGKYMNLPQFLTEAGWATAAKGWSVFDAISSDSAVSPNQYYYDYTMHTKDQGTLTFGETPEDHSTRVIGERAVMRLQQADQTDPLKPVFQFLPIYNTHAPDIPMPGLENDPRWAACNNMPAWNPPNYNEADMSDKSAAMQSLPLQPYADGWPMVNDCREMLGVDWLVGQVVNQLKNDGRYANTMFVFTADNGMAWGQHRLGEVKQYPYVTQVPLYYSWPAHWVNPTTIHEYVSDIDFAPTICEIGGCTLGPYPGGQTKPDGVSLLPLLDGTLDSGEHHLARDALLEDSFETRDWIAVRTTSQSPLGLWHYIEYPNGFRELYDETNDPWELSNVASDPANQDLETQLHQRLWELLAEGRPNKPATIVVVEDSVPNGTPDFAFSGNLGSFSLDDDSDATLPRKKVFTGLAPGTYTVTQAKAPGWTLTGISCGPLTTINVASGTVTFHVLANDSVTCTFKNTRRRPDLSIAQVSSGPFKGDNTYSPTPLKKQTQRRDPVAPGQEYDYFVNVQNDGKLNDAFTLKADVTGPSSMGATFWAGATDVTASVMAGNYKTATLAPGTTTSLLVRVLVAPDTVAGAAQVILIHGMSVAEPAAVDVVRAVTID